MRSSVTLVHVLDKNKFTLFKAQLKEGRVGQVNEKVWTVLITSVAIAEARYFSSVSLLTRKTNESI